MDETLTNRKNIGLVGYYGWGNYGDEYFFVMLRDQFSDCAARDVTGYPNTVSSGELRKRVDEQDAIIIGGGDLVIPFFFSEAYWNKEYLRRPVFIHGVGVPRWGGYDERVALKMRQFFQHENVQRISARDVESRDWIEKYLQPKVEVVFEPDIVCALDFPDRKLVPNQFGIVLRHQTKPPDPKHLEFLLNAVRSAGMHPKFIVLGTKQTKDDDISKLPGVELGDTEIVLRDTIEELTNALLDCEKIASMKFHGCVVAMAAGRPTLALSGADKFKSFYSMCGRSDWIAPFGSQGFTTAVSSHLDATGFEFPGDLRESAKQGLENLRDTVLAI